MVSSLISEMLLKSALSGEIVGRIATFRIESSLISEMLASTLVSATVFLTTVLVITNSEISTVFSVTTVSDAPVKESTSTAVTPNGEAVTISLSITYGYGADTTTSVVYRSSK